MANVKPGGCPTWKRSVLRWISTWTPLAEVYRRVGWSDGMVWTRTVHQDLRFSEAVKLADALGAPRLEFLELMAQDCVGPVRARKGWDRLATQNPLRGKEHKFKKRGKGRRPPPPDTGMDEGTPLDAA